MNRPHPRIEVFHESTSVRGRVHVFSTSNSPRRLQFKEDDFQRLLEELRETDEPVFPRTVRPCGQDLWVWRHGGTFIYFSTKEWIEFLHWIRTADLDW